MRNCGLVCLIISVTFGGELLAASGYGLSNLFTIDNRGWSEPEISYAVSNVFTIDNRQLSSAPNPADISLDGVIDIADLLIMVDQWLSEPRYPSADIAPNGGDGIVNSEDFAALASVWLTFQ